MNKELTARVELSLSNAKHVLSAVKDANIVYIPSSASAEIVYLIEKIEALQGQIDELKLKNRKVKL